MPNTKQTLWNFKILEGNADRNIWRIHKYACKCCKNANTWSFWYSLHSVNILFVYVWYFSEFLTSVVFSTSCSNRHENVSAILIISSVSTYRNMHNGICMDFHPFSPISAVFQCIWELYFHIPVAFLHMENTFQGSSPCASLHPSFHSSIWIYLQW